MTDSLEKDEPLCFTFRPKGEWGANRNNRRYAHDIIQKQFLSKYTGEDKQSQFASEWTLDFCPEKSASLFDFNQQYIQHILQ